MVDRINNASGVLGALKQLQSANRDLSTSDTRVSSGLRVARARDDASAFNTAAVMRGQGASLSVVTLSLSRAESISDTAIAAGEQAMKQLSAMKATASQAMSGGLTDDQRAVLQKQYQDQMSTLQSFIRNSSFDDTNILDGSQQRARHQQLDGRWRAADLANQFEEQVFRRFRQVAQAAVHPARSGNRRGERINLLDLPPLQHRDGQVDLADQQQVAGRVRLLTVDAGLGPELPGGHTA